MLINEQQIHSLYYVGTLKNYCNDKCLTEYYSAPKLWSNVVYLAVSIWPYIEIEICILVNLDPDFKPIVFQMSVQRQLCLALSDNDFSWNAGNPRGFKGLYNIYQRLDFSSQQGARNPSIYLSDTETQSSWQRSGGFKMLR